MILTQYAVIDDGNGTIGPSTVIGPSFIGTLADGYDIDFSFVTRPIDLRNVAFFGALCSFLTSSTLAGTLALQVCDDPQLADQTGAPNQYANWLTITNANVAGDQIVAAYTVVSGSIVLPFEYQFPSHRWIRFKWTYTSGTGAANFAYTLKSVHS